MGSRDPPPRDRQTRAQGESYRTRRKKHPEIRRMPEMRNTRRNRSDGGHALLNGLPTLPYIPCIPCIPYRNELISIVSSRPGPTPIAEIGAPDISSSAFTYAWAFFGRSENDFALVMSSDQPGRVS